MRSLALVAALAVGGLVAAVPASAAPKLLVTTPTSPISAVAAGPDRDLALVACGRVLGLKGSAVALAAQFVGAGCYSSPRSSAGSLTVSGNRVTWVVRGGGNNLESMLVQASGSTHARRIGFLELVEDSRGSFFDGVEGAGSLLAYARVRSVQPDDPSCAPACQLVTTTNVTTLPAGAPRHVVASFQGDARLVGVGAGRLVVATADDRLVVLSQNGGVLFEVNSDTPPIAAAVTQKWLYVLRQTQLQGFRLDGSQAFGRRLAGRAGQRQLGHAEDERGTLTLRRNVAVYVGGRSVFAMRLSDGRQARVALGPAIGPGTARGVAGAVIGPRGIVYAFNDRCRKAFSCRGRVFRAPVPTAYPLAP